MKTLVLCNFVLIIVVVVFVLAQIPVKFQQKFIKSSYYQKRLILVTRKMFGKAGVFALVQ